MKRWGDSQAFISLISVIFILLASMAMTGCATSTALTTAAYKGQTDVVKDLLDKGADPNESGACAYYWPNVTALSCAADGGHIETVKVLVDRGADVNAATSPFSGNWSPLMFAVDRGHAHIAKLLIERGADIEGALSKLKKSNRKKGYELLERLAKKQQKPSNALVSPQTLPTALPLPTETAAPF